MNKIAIIVTLSIIAVAGITILILWLTGVLFKNKTQEDHSKDFISGFNQSGFMLDPRIENYQVNTITQMTQMTKEDMEEYNRLENILSHLNIIKENLKIIRNNPGTSINILELIKSDPTTKPPDDLDPDSIVKPLEQIPPDYEKSINQVERVIRGVESKIQELNMKMYTISNSEVETTTQIIEEETEEDVNKELEGIIKKLKNTVAYKDLEEREISIANTTKDEILASLLTVSSNELLRINLFRETGNDDINQYKNRKKIICQNEDVTKNTLELITNSIPGNILFSKLVDMMRPMVLVNDDKTEPFYIAEVTCTSQRDNKTNLCLEEEPENISITLRDFIENNVPMFGVESTNRVGSYKIRANPNERDIAPIKFKDQTSIKIVPKTLYGEGSRSSHVRKLYENDNKDNPRMQLKYNEVSMSAKQFNQLMKTYKIEILSKYLEESFKDCGA